MFPAPWAGTGKHNWHAIPFTFDNRKSRTWKNYLVKMALTMTLHLSSLEIIIAGFTRLGLWQLKMYGHKDVRIMNGGRKKWLAEGHCSDQRCCCSAIDKIFGKTEMNPFAATPTRYKKQWTSISMVGCAILAVRFTGKILSPPGLPETCQRWRRTHTGAVNIPWAQACNEDGTFKSGD